MRNVFSKTKFQERISEFRSLFLSFWSGSFVPFLRQLCTFRWWASRTWKFRVQFLTVSASCILLLLSCLLWWNWETEHALLCSKFMRMQLFGPQELVFLPESGNGTEKLHDGNGRPCRFHIEMRQPYGDAIPNVRIEARLQKPNGDPFWIYSDRTGPDGTFHLPFPQIQLSEWEVLNICAIDGGKRTEFQTLLPTRKLEVTESSESSESSGAAGVFQDADAFSHFEPELHDETLKSFCSRYEIRREERSQDPSTWFQLERRCLEGEFLSARVFSTQGKYHPVFLGVWQNGVLLVGRPVAANKKGREVSLKLPPSLHGPLTILLVDCAFSPSSQPKVLQHELVWCCTAGDAESQARQTRKIRNCRKLYELAEERNTPEFRENEQMMEFLPMDLNDPPELASSTSVSPEQVSLPTDSATISSLLDTADQLLACSLAGNISEKDAFSVSELERFHAVLELLDPIAFDISESAVRNAGQFTVPERSLCGLMEKALEIQSAVINRAYGETRENQIYLPHLPVIFDSLSAPEASLYRSEMERFRKETLVRIKQRSLILLCSAIGLFLLILLTVFLRFSDGKPRLFSLLCVLFVLVLSFHLLRRSDVERYPENVEYSIFAGVGDAIQKDANQEDRQKDGSQQNVLPAEPETSKDGERMGV